MRGVNALPTSLLDPGDDRRLPLSLACNSDMKICRASLPVDSAGASETPRGYQVRPGLSVTDPRWQRPLPWTTWQGGVFCLLNFLTAGGLALLNVVLPRHGDRGLLALVRLAVNARDRALRKIGVGTGDSCGGLCGGCGNNSRVVGAGPVSSCVVKSNLARGRPHRLDPL